MVVQVGSAAGVGAGGLSASGSDMGQFCRKGLGTGEIVLQVMQMIDMIWVLPVIPAAAAAPAMKSVLIVEDHADIRRLLRLTLELEDYVIHEAGSAPVGLAAARELRPDIVLLDVMMPGAFDGLECCRRLKAEPATRHARVVMLTARGHSHDCEAGLAAGADAYLVKPFSPLQLLDVLRGDSRADAGAGAARTTDGLGDGLGDGWADGVTDDHPASAPAGADAC